MTALATRHPWLFSLLLLAVMVAAMAEPIHSEEPTHAPLTDQWWSFDEQQWKVGRVCQADIPLRLKVLETILAMSTVPRYELDGETIYKDPIDFAEAVIRFVCGSCYLRSGANAIHSMTTDGCDSIVVDTKSLTKGSRIVVYQDTEEPQP